MVVGEQAAADLQRLLDQRLGLGVLSLGLEVGRQVVVAAGGVGVVVGEQAAEDLQRLLVQRLGLGVLSLGLEVERQVVVPSSSIGVVVGEQAAEDLQRLLQQRLGLGVLPSSMKVVRQVVVDLQGVAVVLAERLDPGGQRHAVEGLSLGAPSLLTQVVGDAVVAGSGFGVLLPQGLKLDGQRLAEEGLGLGAFLSILQVEGESGIGLRDLGVVVGEQTAADFQCLLQQRLGLSILPLGVEGFRLLIHGIGRLVGDSILVRHRGHPAQRLETPLRVHRLEVLRPLNSRPQGEQFLGNCDRLVPAIGLQRRLDGLVQFLRPLGVVAGQLSQSRCWGLRFLRGRGLGGCGQARDFDSQRDQQRQPEHDAKSFHDGPRSVSGNVFLLGWNGETE